MLAMVKADLESTDLEINCGNHPRLRVVDHTSFIPCFIPQLNSWIGIAHCIVFASEKNKYGRKVPAP